MRPLRCKGGVKVQQEQEEEEEEEEQQQQQRFVQKWGVFHMTKAFAREHRHGIHNYLSHAYQGFWSPPFRLM